MNDAVTASDPPRASPRLAFSPAQSRVLTAAAVVLGVGLSVIFSERARRAEAQRIEENFRSLTSYQVAANNERVRLITELLAGLRRFATYQNVLTRAEFDGISNEIFARYPGFMSLQWVKIVPRAEREETERRLHADYGYPISIKWRTSANTFRPAGDREEYRVIRYAMPLDPNAIVLGYDVLTAPTAVFQDRAAATGELAVSAPFRLAQTNRDDEELGVIFILPVFGLEETQPRLRGFVQGVFRVSGIFAPSVLPEYREHAIYRYFDQTDDPANPTLLLATDNSNQPPPLAGDGPSGRPRVMRETMTVGGREWLFVAEARPAWVASLRTHQSELILGGGFTMTILATLLLVGFFRRARWVDRLVTERTQTLLTQQGELQAILDHSPNAIWIKDLRGRYVLANRELEKIYGQPIEHILGETDDLFYPPDISADMRAADQRARETDSHILIEGEYEIRGEKRHYYTVKFPVRRENGELFGVGGIATDVTTFKRVETQLAETQKLESLGVLAGGIAHDFNNLLTGMLGNASLIAHELPADHEIGQSAREIETAARRAAELCRQMLAYSGRGKFVIERLDLSRAVAELVPLLRSSIGSRVDLRLDAPTGLPPVDVDPAQLRQIIMNLVINAGEALPESGGWVRVSTGTREVDRTTLRRAIGRPDLPVGEYVCFRVQDNGSGIDPETQRRMFEPFYTTKFTGRGLGLSAVLGIVRSHQGALLVDSAVGRGTTFDLLLPVAQGDAAPRAANGEPVRARPPLRGLRIFLVEDEPAVYQLVTRVLVQGGAHVTAYQDGARAAAEFRPGDHDFAVLDLTLPGLGGRDILLRLRALNPDLPVLLISGYTEQEAADQFSTVKPNGFLQKPFTSAELLNALDTIRQAPPPATAG